MTWSQNLRLRVKLLGAFAVVLALLAVVDVVALTRLALLDSLLREMYEQHTQALNLALEAQVQRILSGRMEQAAVATDDPAEAAQYADTARQAMAAATAKLDELKALVRDEELRRAVSQAQRDLSEVQAGREKVLQLAVANEDGSALALAR
ncbi:MAG TPA: MCP four helix bundle domain-containing protein, partial [Chloroflexota bacterium]|nr:MCP four helix bundle domain-containing protein [Chloroflexota bacterium]